MFEKLILKIVQDEMIESQEELLKKVESLSQQRIDQSTLSRKLKKLNIAKQDGVYKVEEKKSFFSKQVIRYISVAEPNLIVIKTVPGVANSIALVIDNEVETKNPDFSGIAGTVAGDDTVFAAIKSPSTLDMNKKMFEKFFL